MEITVRHAEPDDYEALHRIFSGPRVIAGTLQPPFPPAELWRKRLAGPSEGDYSLVACAEGDVIGELSLYTSKNPRLRHSASFGMAVRDDWHGRGVGSALMEAVLNLAENWLGLWRLELHVFTDNVAAIALYEKFGFETEGTHRRSAFRDGKFVDVYSMARIRV